MLNVTQNHESPQALEAAEEGQSLWKDGWRRLRRNRLAVGGGVIVLTLSLLCFAGPFFLHYSYEEQNLSLRQTPPGAAHWLGTDKLGRDQLSRILYGGRVSLMVGLCATVVSLTIGVLYGAVSGFVGGKLDAVMMRIVDILYALPFTIFVILLMVFFGRNIILLNLVVDVVQVWLNPKLKFE